MIDHVERSFQCAGSRFLGSSGVPCRRSIDPVLVCMPDEDGSGRTSPPIRLRSPEPVESFSSDATCRIAGSGSCGTTDPHGPMPSAASRPMVPGRRSLWPGAACSTASAAGDSGDSAACFASGCNSRRRRGEKAVPGAASFPAPPVVGAGPLGDRPPRIEWSRRRDEDTATGPMPEERPVLSPTA